MKRIVFIILILILILLIKIEWARGQGGCNINTIGTDIGPDSFNTTLEVQGCNNIQGNLPLACRNIKYIQEAVEGIVTKQEIHANDCELISLNNNQKVNFKAYGNISYPWNIFTQTPIVSIKEINIISPSTDSNLNNFVINNGAFKQILEQILKIWYQNYINKEIEVPSADVLRSNYRQKIQEIQASAPPPPPPDPCAKYEKKILGIVPDGFPWLSCKLTVAMINIAVFFLKGLIWFIAAVIKNIAWLAFQIMGVWLKSVVVPLVDFASSLNPFTSQYQNPPGYIVWRTLRDLAYIVLVFIALYAAFVWLQEGMGGATPIIFNVLLVALVINFSYAFVKLAWDISFNIQHGITFNMPLGAGISAAFWSANPLGSWWEALGDLQNSGIPSSAEEVGRITGEFDPEIDKDYKEYVSRKIGELQGALFNALAEAGKGVIPLGLLLFLIIILSSLIVFFILRYVYILILAGFSPFAILSLAVPQAKKGGFAGIIPTIFAGISSDLFNKWVENLTKWLINGPLIIIFIILGIVIQQNFVVNFKSQNVDLASFMLAFAFMTVWFLFTWNLAISVAGKWAERIGILSGLLPGIIAKEIGWWALKRTGLGRRAGRIMEDTSSLLKRSWLYNAPIINRVVRPLAAGLEKAGKGVAEFGVFEKKPDELKNYLNVRYFKSLKEKTDLQTINKISQELIRDRRFIEAALYEPSAKMIKEELIRELDFNKVLALVHQAHNQGVLNNIKDYFEGNAKDLVEAILEQDAQRKTKRLRELIKKLNPEEIVDIYQNNIIPIIPQQTWENIILQIFDESLDLKTIENILSAAQTLQEAGRNELGNLIRDWSDGVRGRTSDSAKRHLGKNATIARLFDLLGRPLPRESQTGGGQAGGGNFPINYLA